jgi:hypothetical protein
VRGQGCLTSYRAKNEALLSRRYFKGKPDPSWWESGGAWGRLGPAWELRLQGASKSPGQASRERSLGRCARSFAHSPRREPAQILPPHCQKHSTIKAAGSHARDSLLTSDPPSAVSEEPRSTDKSSKGPERPTQVLPLRGAERRGKNDSWGKWVKGRRRGQGGGAGPGRRLRGTRSGGGREGEGSQVGLAVKRDCPLESVLGKSQSVVQAWHPNLTSRLMWLLEH